MKKRVLVTGASGFIGRQTIPYLEAAGFEICEADIARHDLLDSTSRRKLLEETRPTHLLHLAWYTKHGEFWASEENHRWEEASLDLVRLFREYGGKRAVLAGTCAEYTWDKELLDEDRTPIAPKTLYGVCKSALHGAVKRLSAETGLSYAWGRVFLLYGPHEGRARLVPGAIVPLLEGREAEFSHGLQIRDFMHVEDVARAFVHVLDSDFQGPLNIASGEGVALKEVVGKIAAQIGRPDLVHLGARPAPAGDPPRLVATVGKLRGTGFKPKYDLDSGLKATIEWWKKEGLRNV